MAASTPSTIENMIRAGQLDPALRAIRADETKTPKDARLWTLEGVVLSMQKDDAGALKAFDHALTLSPAFPSALRGEVQIYSQTEDPRAVPLLEQIIQADPQDTTAHEMLGLLESKAGDCGRAETEFGLSGDAPDRHARSLELYGGCLVQSGDVTHAIPVFEKLSALRPDADYARYDLAVVLVEAKAK